MASAGDTVYPTVAELAGLGTWVSQSITGLDFPAGYKHQLLSSGSLSLSITEASAKAAGHAIEDLSIEIQAPPVSATDCKSTFTFAGLDLSHRNNVGLYGPHPAHTHTDWVGSDGAGNPDSGGAFTVTGGPGTIALELDSGFATRLGQAAEQDFPAGMPGIPQLYWHHKADLWHEYDGEPGVTSGDPYSCPPEAVYCWRGWGWLLTRLDVPEDCTVTLTVTGKSYSFSDPHCTGSARQTDFEYTGTAFSHTYSQAVTAGDQYVYWCVANPTTEALVDLEVVETVTLSGLAAGNWTLYEPKLVLDPSEAVTEHAVIKAFEAPCQGGDENHAGGGYRKGGFSAHVDAAFYKALFWGDEQNANVAEKCGGMFDLTLSANYEIDNTTAFSLSGLCDLITNCCDAWTCATNSAYTAATTDSDSNTISTWAFDVVPLEQSVDAGKASCSFRCGTWSIAKGIVCKLVTDKYIGGALHGLAHDGATLKRSGAYADVYRRYPTNGTWSIADNDVVAEATGHWCSDSLTEVYEYDGDTPHYYRYGACLTTGTAPSSDVARAPVRETVAWLAGQVAAGGRRIAMFRHPAGNVQCWAWISGNDIKFNRLVSGTSTAGTPVTVDDTGAYDSVDAETDGAYIYVVARRSSDHGVDLFKSYDDGATWSSATDVTGD